nr:hypothetical protein [Mucilaginibacter sp. X5P1]
MYYRSVCKSIQCYSGFVLSKAPNPVVWVLSSLVQTMIMLKTEIYFSLLGLIIPASAMLLTDAGDMY